MDPAHARAIKAIFQRDGSTRFSDVPTSATPNLKTKTVLRNLILGDWAPTMEAIARSLVLAIAIPAAVVLVFAQWLAFTWRRPLAGVLALVPVRRRDPIDAHMDEVFADVAAGFGLTVSDLKRPIEVADSSPNLASSSPQSAPSSPRSESVAPRRQRRSSRRPQSPA